MTDHEIVETIQAIGKALNAAQDLAETYRSAWMGQKDMCDQLSTDVTRLENERDRLREQLEKADDAANHNARAYDDNPQTITFTGKFIDVNGDELKALNSLDDSDDYIEDGGARNAR